MTRDGTIDICSKFELRTPIKNPNKANVNETNINKKSLIMDIQLSHQQKMKQLNRLQLLQLMF